MDRYILTLFLIASAVCVVDCHFGFGIFRTSNVSFKDVQTWKVYPSQEVELRARVLSIMIKYMLCNRANNSNSKRFLLDDHLSKNKPHASLHMSLQRTCNDTIIAETIRHQCPDFNILSSVDVTNDTCWHNISQLNKLSERTNFPISLIKMLCLCLCLHSCFYSSVDLLLRLYGRDTDTWKSNMSSQIWKINHEKQNTSFSKFFVNLQCLWCEPSFYSSFETERQTRSQPDVEGDDLFHLYQAKGSTVHHNTHTLCKWCHFNHPKRYFPNQNRSEIKYKTPGTKHKDIHDSFCLGFCEVTFKIQSSRQLNATFGLPILDKEYRISISNRTPDSNVINAYQPILPENGFNTMNNNLYVWLQPVSYGKLKGEREMADQLQESDALEKSIECFKHSTSNITNDENVLMVYEIIIEVCLIVYISVYLYINSLIMFNINYRSKISIRKTKRKYRPKKNGPLVCWVKTGSQSKRYCNLIVRIKGLFSLFKKKTLLYITFAVNMFFKTLPIPLKTNEINNQQLNIISTPETAAAEMESITSSLETTAGNKKEDKETPDRLSSAIRGTDVSGWVIDNLTVYPVYKQTLESFFKQSAEENTEEINNNAVRFEWIRLGTFRNFGVHIPVSSLSLAKAGFYATGSSDECKCFSCRISYSNWREGDNPFDIHRRISPSCSFINGSESGNICIKQNNDNPSAGTGDSNTHVSNGISEPISNINGSHETENTGAQNGSMNTAGHPVLNQVDHSQTRETATGNHNNASTTRPNTSQIPSRNNPDCARSSERNETTRVGEQQSRNQTDNAHGASRCSNRNKYDQLGITFDKPKYPSYAVLSVRVSSFQGWPSTSGQEPKDLALAGFFYAGYSDYCRCFFCGGGLRNWDFSDDPWVEHGRWFPNCAFVLQNRGPEFVSSALQKNAESEDNNHSEQPESESKSRKELKKREICIQTVMDMGYSRDVIDTAISELQQKGHDRFDAALLLETVFCIEERLRSCNQPRSVEEDAEGATGFDSAHNVDTNNTYIDDVNEHIASVKLDVSDTDALVEENSRLRAQRLCRICREEDATVAFLPCGHLVCCHHCAPALVKCCVCKSFIRGTVKTWLV